MTNNVQPRTRIGKHASLVCITIIVLAGFCFSQSAASPSSEVLTNWTEFHRPNMTRWNPYESVLNVGNVGRLASKWSYATGSSVNSDPAVVNGVVYVGSVDHNVYALKASSGAKLWSFRTGGQVLFSAPAVANGVV
jgi:glucose dehydrogenase